MEYLLGVLVSLIVQVVKKYSGSNTIGTYAILLGVSVLGAAGYYYASSSAYWPTALQILTSAAAFHNLVIRQLDS